MLRLLGLLLGLLGAGWVGGYPGRLGYRFGGCPSALAAALSAIARSVRYWEISSFALSASIFSAYSSGENSGL